MEKDDEGEEAFPESVKTAIEFFHDTGTIVDLSMLLPEVSLYSSTHTCMAIVIMYALLGTIFL